MSRTRVRIELYVDPCCPFAWIAYQWLVEVRRHRAVKFTLHLMSLAMLNEHRSISLGYRRLLAHTWAPARVATAAEREHGPDRLVPLYEAMARRIFCGADHYRVINEDLESVIVEAVSETGLPAQLAEAAAIGVYDDALRASHNAAMAPIGNGVGTPIIHLTVELPGAQGTASNAFFGPVMSGVPRGSEALHVFDGLRLLAGYPRLFEIKRPMSGSVDLASRSPGKPSSSAGRRKVVETAIRSA